VLDYIYIFYYLFIKLHGVTPLNTVIWLTNLTFMWVVRRKVATSNISLHVQHQENTKKFETSHQDVRIKHVTSGLVFQRWLQGIIGQNGGLWQLPSDFPVLSDTLRQILSEVLTHSKNDDALRKDRHSKAKISSLNSPKISHSKDKTRCPWNVGYEKGIPWFGGTNKGQISARWDYF
jgi:hypothetical protein